MIHTREEKISTAGRGAGGLCLREMFGSGGRAFPTEAHNATRASSRGSAISTPALRPSVARPEGLRFRGERQVV